MSAPAYVKCPYCGAQNARAKLATRAGHCRACSHNVQYGLDWLARQREKRRQRFTKEQRRAYRRTAEYKAARAAAKQRAQVRAAVRGVEQAWDRLSACVDGHDLGGAARALRSLTNWTRREARLQARMRANPIALPAGARAIVLPPEKEN